MVVTTKSSKKSAPRRNRNKNPIRVGSSGLLNDGLALAKSILNNQKDLGMERFDFLIERTRDYASSLKTMPIIQDQIDYVANGLTHFSDYIEKTDLDRIAVDAKNFVARNPALTVGITTVIGLAALGSKRQNSRKSN